MNIQNCNAHAVHAAHMLHMPHMPHMRMHMMHMLRIQNFNAHACVSNVAVWMQDAGDREDDPSTLPASRPDGLPGVPRKKWPPPRPVRFASFRHTLLYPGTPYRSLPLICAWSCMAWNPAAGGLNAAPLIPVRTSACPVCRVYKLKTHVHELLCVQCACTIASTACSPATAHSSSKSTTADQSRAPLPVSPSCVSCHAGSTSPRPGQSSTRACMACS